MNPFLLLLAGVSGYLEGRQKADINDLRKMEEFELQMQFDALSEDAKQHVREAAIQRGYDPNNPWRKKRGTASDFVLGLVIGTFLFFGLPILLGVILK